MRSLIISCLAVVLAACTQQAAPTVKPIPDEAPALGATDPTGPVQIVVWSSRALPPRLVAASGRLPGVLAAGARGNGVLDLRGATGATRKIPARPPGAVVPISVTSLTPALLRAFPDFEAAAAVLARGHAIVPRSSAEFRGLERGDIVLLAGNGRTARLRVGAVVDDGRIFRSEIVVPAAVGKALGLGVTRALVLAVSPEEAPAVERRIERALGDFPARVRSGTGAQATSPPSSSSGRLLSLLEMKKTFGEFWYRRVGATQLALDPAWRQRNIVDRRLPLLGVIRCNRRIIPLIRGAMNEIVARGLSKLVRTYDGCYSPRTQVANTDTISRHAYGAAVDINARWNAFGAKPTMDRRIVQIFERWGFAWGGTWTVPDGMHFEFTHFPEASTN